MMVVIMSGSAMDGYPKASYYINHFHHLYLSSGSGKSGYVPQNFGCD